MRRHIRTFICLIALFSLFFNAFYGLTVFAVEQIEEEPVQEMLIEDEEETKDIIVEQDSKDTSGDDVIEDELIEEDGSTLEEPSQEELDDESTEEKTENDQEDSKEEPSDQTESSPETEQTQKDHSEASVEQKEDISETPVSTQPVKPQPAVETASPAASSPVNEEAESHPKPSTSQISSGNEDNKNSTLPSTAITQYSSADFSWDYSVLGTIDSKDWIWPLDASDPGSFVITSMIGHRASPGGIGSTNHMGIDIGASFGTAVLAPEDGVVSVAGSSGGYGNLVELEHSNGLKTRYGHLSFINATVGAHVKKGEIIGFVGSTGNSTGPHLHFEVIKDGQQINGLLLYPESVIEKLTYSL